MTKLLVIRGGLAAIARSEEAEAGRRVAVAATVLPGPVRCGRDEALARAVAEMDIDLDAVLVPGPHPDAWDAMQESIDALDVVRGTLRALQSLSTRDGAELHTDLARESAAFVETLRRVLGGDRG